MMRRTCFPLFLMLFLGYGIAHAQTISSIFPDSAHQGDVISVTITGSGTNFTSGTGANQVMMRFGTQNFPSSGVTVLSPSQCLAQFSIPPTAAPGMWNMEVTNFTNLTTGGIFKITGTTPINQYALVSGSVYHDVNSNGIRDAGEGGLGNRLVTLQPGNHRTSTNIFGDYNIWVPLGTYSITCRTYNFQSVTNPPNITLTVPGNNYRGNDVPVVIPQYPDLRAYMRGQHFRLGFGRNTYLYVYNRGNIPQSGTLFFVPDSSMLAPSYSHTPSGFNGDTVYWNFGNIFVNGSFIVTYRDSIPVQLGLGHPVKYEMWVVPNGGDSIPTNNYWVRNDSTGGSWDPNDKTTFDNLGNELDSIILPGDSLFNYRIRFQNTGTDTAFNIFIRDTIDPDLDFESIRTLSASHNYNFTVNDTFVEWYFPNIMLEDSNRNEPGSHGFVFFEIKYNSNLPQGTTFNNRAAIYFDYNDPVITNTTHQTICDTFTAAYASNGTGSTWNFTNSTSNTTAVWDFGDGNTSTQLNPTHTYANPGSYNVCLIATNSCGRKDTACTQVNACFGNFAAAFTNTNSFYTANFTDQTTGGATQWLWDFGDGNTSSQQNPTHTYAANGNYTVCLYSQGPCGSDTTCQVVNVTCTRPASNYSSSVSGAMVSFSDQSNGSPNSWFWDFGDGNTSTQQSPMHQYNSQGTYTVCLISSNICGSDTTCQVVTITCNPAVANFSQAGGQNSATFTDLSSGAVSSWFWDFGDGNTSTQQSPTHQYSSPGTYTVCLIASGNCGSDTTCSQVTIFCNDPVANFTTNVSQLGVYFNDLSGNTLSWFWDFGDGNSSSQQNPTHVYSSPGSYTACLYATNSCGTDTLCQTFSVGCAAPNANFAFSGTFQSMNFIDLSGNGPTSWAWDFGDGNTSTQQNPTHTYASAGIYNVCLVASSICGADSTCLNVDLTTGLEFVTLLDNLQVYPNPVSDILRISGEWTGAHPITYRIFDPTGRLIQPEKEIIAQGVFQTEISVVNLAEGIYFLEIRSGDLITRKKVIKN